MRVAVKDETDAEKLSELEREHSFDFWSSIRIGKHVDVMTSPESSQTLESWLLENNLDWSIMISDVESLMKLEQVPVGVSGADNRVGHNMDWTSYHPIEDMHSYLTYLQDTYDFVTLESIGKSHEGSDMIIAKVCKGGCGDKPAMWIDGGIHAREWISPATVTWMLKELVENDAAHADLLENLDW